MAMTINEALDQSLDLLAGIEADLDRIIKSSEIEADLAGVFERIFKALSEVRHISTSNGLGKHTIGTEPPPKKKKAKKRSKAKDGQLRTDKPRETPSDELSGL